MSRGSKALPWVSTKGSQQCSNSAVRRDGAGGELGHRGGHRVSDSQGQALAFITAPLPSVPPGTPFTPGTLSSACSLGQPDSPPLGTPHPRLSCTSAILPLVPDSWPQLSLPARSAVPCHPRSAWPVQPPEASARDSTPAHAFVASPPRPLPAHRPPREFHTDPWRS